MEAPSVDTPRVVMIVPNEVSDDARVKKTARSAAAAGCEVIVVGYSKRKSYYETWMGPVRIIRLNPERLLGRPQRPPAVDNRVLNYVIGYRDKQSFKYAVARRNLRRQMAVATKQRLRRRLARTQEEGQRGPGVIVRLTALRSWLSVYSFYGKIREKIFKVRRLAYRGRALPLPLVSRARPRRPFFAKEWHRTYPHLLDFELAFGQQIDTLQPDILHCHDFLLIGAAANAKIRAEAAGHRLSLVYDAHEYVAGLEILEESKHRALIDLERAYLPECDAIMTVSAPLAERLAKDHGLKELPEVVLNTPQFHSYPAGVAPSLRAHVGLPEDVPLLVYSGAVKEARGVHTIVEGLPRLPDVHLAIVSNDESPYIESLKGRAEDDGTARRLSFLSYVPAHLVSAFVASATIGVVPLTHYGNAEVALPNKLFDYVHAQLPVVAADTEALANFVRDTGIGEVYQADSPEDFAAAVGRVLADPDPYRAPLCDHRLRERYSWQHQERVMLGVYSRLLERSMSPSDVTPVSLDEVSIQAGEDPPTPQAVNHLAQADGAIGSRDGTPELPAAQPYPQNRDSTYDQTELP